MLTLILSFFVIALLYATVGFGGGTSYIAILAAGGVAYTLIPKISLLCNLLVVSGGCYHFMKEGHFNKKLILPFVLSSVPMAFLGGLYPLTEKTFFILLTVSLILCGVRILFLPDRKIEEVRPPGFILSFFVGSILGLLSGMVGIGGGIFLSPILINMGWARSKDAAAVASMFILVNSLAGLAGQFMKDSTLPETSMLLPLFVAVIVGGQIGSRIGTHSKVSYNLIQKGTGILTLFISIRLLLKTIS
jgi:uncharacterized membrane protein YfcA